MPSSGWDHSGAWCRFRGKADWRREARRPRARPESRFASLTPPESLSSAATAGADLDRRVSPECPLLSPLLLRSANGDDAQTSWWRADGAAGERRGGCATVTAPTVACPMFYTSENESLTSRFIPALSRQITV